VGYQQTSRRQQQATVFRGMSHHPDRQGDNGLAVQETKPKLKKPRLYRVILLNDDYTPMEFVVIVLEKYFSKPREQAVQIMLHVHQRGTGVCGLYPLEIAETKVQQVMDFAQEHEHPLQCTMEPE
jgi:ATP-dependent Clp protease adaptor protein ClpS